VTVCTNDLALVDLAKDILPVAGPKSGGDAELLGTEMIELQDDWIGLAAVDAGTFPKEPDQESHAFGDE
jgi:hypothetical protein